MFINERIKFALAETEAALEFVQQFYQDHFEVMPVAFQSVDSKCEAVLKLVKEAAALQAKMYQPIDALRIRNDVATHAEQLIGIQL